MIRLIDLYRVVGRKLTRKLIAAKWIEPIQSGDSRMSVFDDEKVHRALGRLTRDGSEFLPRWTLPPRRPERKLVTLEEISFDPEELEQLSTQDSRDADPA